MSKGLYKNSDILSLSQFDQKSLTQLFKATKRIIALIINNKCSNVLKGSAIALLFFEPSTRTHNSFSSAAQRLGAGVIGIQDTSLTSMLKGESFEDTIRMIDGYSDLIVIRHPENGSAKRAADAASVPVINAGDGSNEHPTQALLDLYTIYSKFGKLSSLKILVAGDLLYGRTARSLLQGLSLFKGNTIYLLSPKKLRMDSNLIKNLKNKLKIIEIETEKQIPTDCNVWYWTRIQKERIKSKALQKSIKNAFIITKKLLTDKGNKKMIIMHPLPRVGEIATEVDTDPRAYYFQQAKNGLYIRMALLALILKKI